MKEVHKNRGLDLTEDELALLDKHVKLHHASRSRGRIIRNHLLSIRYRLTAYFEKKA